MPPVPARSPTGFLLLALLLSLTALGGIVRLVLADAPADGPWSALQRLDALVGLALTVVLVEALWNCRPWVGRAALGWGVVQGIGLVLPALGALVLTGFGSLSTFLVLYTLLAGGVLLLAVCYVWSRARTLFPPAVPRPRPVP